MRHIAIRSRSHDEGHRVVLTAVWEDTEEEVTRAEMTTAFRDLTAVGYHVKMQRGISPTKYLPVLGRVEQIDDDHVYLVEPRRLATLLVSRSKFHEVYELD